MKSPGDAPAEPTESRRTATFFLSIYLLLLSFFILLNSVSTFQAVRAKAVMESLAITFSTLMPSREAAFASNNGNVAAAREFLQSVGGVFETAIPAVKVRTIQPGRLMQIALRLDELFLPDKAEVRPGQGALLNRLVAALSAAPAGLRYEMTFLVGNAPDQTGGLPIGEDLSVARAGALAREMVRRGAPPDAVVIGLMPGDPASARAVFRVIGDEDGAPPPSGEGG